jgi:hypothetical protein
MKTVAYEQSGDDNYHVFLQDLREHFLSATYNPAGSEKLFTTDAYGLWNAYLNNFPPEWQQHFNCHACRDFIGKYGGLVTIRESGETTPVMWQRHYTDGIYKKSVEACYKIVKKAKVTGVFISDKNRLGIRKNDFYHMHVDLQDSMILKSIYKPHEIYAEKKQDFILLARTLHEYTIDEITMAVGILSEDTVNRADKFLNMTKWFLKLKRSLTGNKQNIIWRAVADAPTGFCHIKNTMVGTLLDDIKSGMPFVSIKRRFNDAMNPLKYQRPQTKPDDQNIEQAESIIEKMGCADSLRRRYATIDEIPTIWKPTHFKAPQDGIFGHLKKGAMKDKMEFDAKKISYEKFLADVIPTAISINVILQNRAMNFGAIVTAEIPDSQRILKWDNGESFRNTFSHYVYSGGSGPFHWNLSDNTAHKINGICTYPQQWSGCDYLGMGAILIIDGCRDLRHEKSGLGLFPEILRSEFHPIRKTIEAYSKSEKISGFENSSACGLLLQKNAENINIRLQVETENFSRVYIIDRWG